MMDIIFYVFWTLVYLGVATYATYAGNKTPMLFTALMYMLATLATFTLYFGYDKISYTIFLFMASFTFIRLINLPVND